MRTFNRLLALVLVLFVALIATFTLAGCESTTTSGNSGQTLTLDQLRAETEQLQAQARREAQDQLAEQQRLLAERKAQFERALARLNAETQLAVADLGASFDQDSAAIAGAIASIERNHADRLDELQRNFTLGQSDITRKDAFIARLLDFGANGPVSGIPIPYVGTLGGAVSLLGYFFGRRQGERTGWDEAKLDSTHNQTRTDAAYDEGAARAANAKAVV